jgi:hypothetical protein
LDWVPEISHWSKNPTSVIFSNKCSAKCMFLSADAGCSQMTVFQLGQPSTRA